MASSSSSSTSASNEPPFSITEKTKLAFHQFYNIISGLWARSVQTTSHLNQRRRRYRDSRLWRSRSADDLPLYLTERHRNQNNDNDHFSLGKTILSLTFQAILGLALAFQGSSLSSLPSLSTSTGQSHDEEDVSSVVPLHVVGVAMVIAFAAAFSGVFLKQAFPTAACFFERIGSLFIAIGFFVMTSIFIPKTLRWICWLAFAISLLVFSLAFIR